jgi:hypothetical protein
MAKCRPGPKGGKATVVGEETGAGTTRAAGVGGQARRDRGAERTAGRAVVQQGLATTCQDWPIERGARGTEEGGLAHEPIVVITIG